MKRHIVIHIGLVMALSLSLVLPAYARAVVDPDDVNRNTRMKYLQTNPDLLKKRVNVDRTWTRNVKTPKPVAATGAVTVRPIRLNARLLRALAKQKKASNILLKRVPKVTPGQTATGSTMAQ